MTTDPARREGRPITASRYHLAAFLALVQVRSIELWNHIGCLLDCRGNVMDRNSAVAGIHRVLGKRWRRVERMTMPMKLELQDENNGSCMHAGNIEIMLQPVLSSFWIITFIFDPYQY